MPLPYAMKDSWTHYRLSQIAKSLGGKVASDFSGVTVGSWNVLYRYGTEYLQPRGKRKYPRWNWDVPFGRPADRRKVDFVLLCGPAISDVKEMFFLCTSAQASRFANVWPKELNFAARPVRELSGNRADFWRLRLPLSQIFQRLTGKRYTPRPRRRFQNKVKAALPECVCGIYPSEAEAIESLIKGMKLDRIRDLRRVLEASYRKGLKDARENPA